MTPFIYAVLLTSLGLSILLRTVYSLLPSLAATARQYPGQSALWGIGAMFIFVALTIFLATTLIGIPLIPLLSLIVSLTSLVVALGVSLFIGQQVIKSDRRSSLQQFSIGLLIITILALVPFIGGIVVWVVSLLGWGSLLVWKLGKA